MKLHLPVLLRKALLACFAFSLASGAAHAADLTLGGEDLLTIDYAEADSIPDLAGCTLQLQGDTNLLLSNCGSGDGKTYTLFTGVSGLVDAEGNPISLDSTNNAISNYFDITQPGSGFWADAILQLSNDGSLQLVRHSESVKNAVTVTRRQSGGADYQYYEGVIFADIYTSISSSASGGAIYGSTITLSNNGSVVFEGNTASSTGTYAGAYGGAIYGGSSSTITLSNNGSVVFAGNSASGSYYAHGGAIYGDEDCTITLSNNGSVVFEGNTASGSTFAYGGAIYGDEDCTITLSDNGSVVFEGNTASGSTFAYGGAIDGDWGSTITLSNNGSVVFEGNTASATGSSHDYASGGAIYGGSSSTITLSNNGSVVFTGNTASGSYYTLGGAIYGETITLSNNESVTFNGNTASGSSWASGGAIYSSYGNLSIQNNDSVLFEKNAEISEGTYRLRSIYASGYGDVISLSAAAGKSIEFRDAVYIGPDLTVKLNADYGDVKQQGDIVFTGKYTEQHLNDLLDAAEAGRTATAREILDSRTTEVYAMTNLYGGRLRVEDGGIYQGYGITALEGSAATVRVKDASLFHNGYNLTFNSGTTLELGGNNTITGDVQMLDGSVLSFDASETNGTSYIYGGVTIGGALTIANVDSWSGENALLMYVTGAVSGWDANNITIQSNNYIFDDFTWVGNALVLNYNADSFEFVPNPNPYYKGHLLVRERQVGDICYQSYNSVCFRDNSGAYTGGAIYGDSYSTIMLSDNGSVLFEGNTASSSSDSAEGGAIYGLGFCPITLSNNGSVVFEGNTASSTGSYGGAYGGAIFGYSASTITLSNNVSVIFEGNTASSTDDPAYGGAIYGGSSSTIELSNNGSVVFEGNTATVGGAIYGGGNTPITLSDNGSVVFEGNSSSAYGGAICGGYSSPITLSNNGSVEFSGNTASGLDSAVGGAIYGYWDCPITLSNNGSVLFEGNTASSGSDSAKGGAIYAYGNLSIQNNDSVFFEKNAEVTDGDYRLRSVYVQEYGTFEHFVVLSAAADKSIEFRDSVYIGSDATVNLNEDYTDAEGKVHKQQGEIVFTGKYTEQHLNELLEAAGAGRTATAQEILKSRTSEVYTMTNLYGGRLRVEDGAIYQGYGITAHAGSASTVRVKDAELHHAGYDLTFNAGTTLELEGGNSISGNVQMLDDSTLRFIYAADSTLSMTGNLSFEGSVTIELEGFGEGSYELVSQNGGTLSGWDMDALRFMNGQGESLDASRFAWVDSSLYFMNSDFQSIVWTNATGDGLWNNVSLNWEADGTPFAFTVLQNIILGAGGNETITMVGNQAVNSLTVQQGGQYTLAGDTAGTKLTVTGDVLLGENASLSIQGNLESGALKGAGSLSVSGTLTLTDATASSSIGGDVSVSGALKTAGVLTVGGALKAGSLAGGSNELAVSGNITLGSMTGDANVLTSGGSATTGAINGSHNSITAVTLVTTNGKALTGDYNTLEATAGQVFVQGQLKGNYNTLKGGKAPADGNTISVWSGINGNNNVLLAEEGNVVTHAINGSHNLITAAALVTTNGRTLTGDYNTLESTAGQVYVQGELTGSHNTLKASAAPSASDPNALCVWGGIVGDYNQLLTTGGNIAMTSSSSAKVQGNHNTLEATEGAILVRDILGTENRLTAGTYISAGAVGAAGAGSNGNTLTAGTYIQTSSLTGDANTLSAGTYVNINGKLTGDSNDISSSGTDSGNGNGIRIATGLEGDGNKLTAEAGRIVIGGGTSLNGSNNTLLAKGATSGGEGITLDGNLAGSGNKLTAETGNIKLGSITGDSNTLEAEAGTITASTINGTGNTLKGATVQVNGELKGSANTIEGNAVQVGTLSGSGHGITALAGNVTINSLNTTTGNTISTGASYGITVGSGSASNQTWTAGSLSVTWAAGLSLTDSTVTVSGTVESAKLNLGGASSLAAATLSVNSVSLLTDAAVSMTLETADVAELYLQAGATLDVNGTLNAGTVTMQQLTSSAPGLTVGQFAAGETIFCLDVEMVNALNLGHGESVVLARADQAISGDFSAWLTSAGNSSLDAAVYRYDISVSGAEVVLTMDYANWGTRVWYGNTWVGKESWSEYMVCGYDVVDGVETVDLGGSSIAADALYIAAGEDAFTTVMANGSMSAAYAEVDGKLTIAESCALEIGELAAGAQEVQLQGELTVDTGSIGKLSGTTGELVIVDEVNVNSDVTLGSLDNSGTLDIGSHSLKVASAVTNGGSVVAGNVVVHNRMSGYAVFAKLVADKVTVTNTSDSSAYTDNLSVGDGSAIGELVAEKLQVRDGVVTLGRTDAATEQELQSIELQKGADLVLQGQTSLGVTDTVAMTAGSTVQIQSGATLQNGAVSLSAAPGTAAAQLSSKTGGNLLEMQRDTRFCIQDMLLVNTSIRAAEGTAVMLSGVEGSGNVYLQGGADFSLTFGNTTADDEEPVIVYDSPVTGITLSAGSTLTLAMDPTNNSFRDYNLVINMQGFAYDGGSLAATGGIADLSAAGIYLGGWLGELLAAQGVVQEGVGNLESPEVPGGSVPTVSYTYSTDNNVGMIISIHGLSVPEPTTTTLSLLALTALAMRRRRK